MKSPFKQFSIYMNKIRADPLPPCDSFEEIMSDQDLNLETQNAKLLTSYDIEPNPQICPNNIKFFIDGVQRTVALYKLNYKNYTIPFFLSHLIAGATVRNDTKLEPEMFCELYVLLFPLNAVRAAGWDGPDPPGLKLDHRGQIYSKITQSDCLFYSDTSESMQLNPKILLKANDLAAMGNIRSKSLNRTTELLRILELGILWKIRSKYPEEWVLLDGPVAYILKHSRLVDDSLKGLQKIANKDQTYSFLRRVIGAVKKVTIVPNKNLDIALSKDRQLSIPVFEFSDTIKQNDAVGKCISSAFIWLRRELANQISTIWSNSSGLARLDIPYPCLVENDQSWYLPNYKLNLNQNSDARQNLQDILTTMIAERWPVPDSTPHRKLVEYFPIAETERWLKSMLRSPQELQAMII